MIQSNLKEMLHQRRMSIREFARLIDFRFESVRLLYNNEMTRIPVDLMEKVCRELECTPGELFTLINEEEMAKNESENGK